MGGGHEKDFNEAKRRGMGRKWRKNMGRIVRSETSTHYTGNVTNGKPGTNTTLRVVARIDKLESGAGKKG